MADKFHISDKPDVRAYRLQTLKLSIADAEKRIDSNFTDRNYVADQRAKQRRWQDEIDVLRIYEAEQAVSGAPDKKDK